MKKYNVQFEVGQSDRTLYAECRIPEGASDDYGYFALKAEILRQAAEHGIPAECIAFQYDGQEQHLADDANAEAEVRGW